ncbi:MAG: helix-turn-helix domain-containing protein, partial [Frisingicoccus sp.]
MILAEKIVFLRKRKGWSQEELADKLDISRQSVSKWELGASIPDLDKIIKLSDLFDVTTDYLLKDDAQEIACDVSEVFEEVSEPSARKVSVEEANLFMDLTERLSGRIAFAVSLFILSPVPLLFLGGVAEYKHSRLTDDMAGGFGVTILLVLVAIGVAILILNGMQLSEYEYLEK